MSIIGDIQKSIQTKGRMPIEWWYIGRVFYVGDEIHADLYGSNAEFIRTRKLTESEIAELSNQVTLRNQQHIV